MAQRPTTALLTTRTQSAAYDATKDNAQDFNEQALILDDHADEIEANATAIAGKVDKVTGKGLSTEDYTTAEKAKVTNVPSNTTSELAAKADSTAVNAALSNKADLVGGKVPADQLPASVDEVQEYANLAAFPVTGEASVIYIAIDTALSYRWGGTVYAALNTGIALGETNATAYRGDRGKTAYDHSQVTHDKTLVGLGNVDNTSDANKPVSTATQTALNLKVNTADLNAAAVGLGNVENKSSATIRSEIVDGDIPVSIARAADVPTLLSDLTADATHRTVTDVEKAAWDSLAVIGSGTEAPSTTWAFTNDIGNVTLAANLTITTVSPAPGPGPSRKYFTHGAYTLTVLGVTNFVSSGGVYAVEVTNTGTSGAPNYVVRDLNGGGGLSAEDQARLDLIFGLYVPDAPTIATSISGNDISVDITAGSDNGFAITGYRIQMQTDGGGYTTIEATTTDDPYTIVAPGAGVHDVRVYAINAIGESAASNVDSETITEAIIEISDNFNDNSIDTGLWTEVTNANITVAETGGELVMTNGGSSGGVRVGLWGDAQTIQNDLIIIQIKMTQPNSTTFTGRFGLCKDSTELAFRAYLQGSGTAGGTLRFVEVDNNVVTTTETGVTATSGLDVRIKHVPSTNVTTAEYWNGSSWASLGTHSVDLTGTVYPMILASSTAAGVNTVKYDDFFLTFADYSTQYPT